MKTIKQKIFAVLLAMCFIICYTINVNSDGILKAKADTVALVNGAVYKIRNQKSDLYFAVNMADYSI